MNTFFKTNFKENRTNENVIRLLFADFHIFHNNSLTQMNQYFTENYLNDISTINITNSTSVWFTLVAFYRILSFVLLSLPPRISSLYLPKFPP